MQACTTAARRFLSVSTPLSNNLWSAVANNRIQPFESRALNSMKSPDTWMQWVERALPKASQNFALEISTVEFATRTKTHKSNTTGLENSLRHFEDIYDPVRGNVLKWEDE
mmetsp:Transcript_82995/g.222609  ORF Transcript_82995/g.222609 Transcript_82995/m.222609 type:complete len:111 (-) Transcript_82995:134-466(-)